MAYIATDDSLCKSGPSSAVASYVFMLIQGHYQELAMGVGSLVEEKPEMSLTNRFKRSRAVRSTCIIL